MQPAMVIKGEGMIHSARYGPQRSKPHWLQQSVQCPIAQQRLEGMSPVAQLRMADLSWEQHHWTGPDIDIPVAEQVAQPPGASTKSKKAQKGKKK